MFLSLTEALAPDDNVYLMDKSMERKRMRERERAKDRFKLLRNGGIVSHCHFLCGLPEPYFLGNLLKLNFN